VVEVVEVVVEIKKKEPNIRCEKCGHKWYTKSMLRKVTCPSCNQKTPNKRLNRLVKQFVQQKQGIVGLEAAIVLIAFVIIAAAFSFMVINQGLYATQRGQEVIQEGIQQASTPLTTDGTTFVRTTLDGRAVNVFIVPLKAFGVKYVPMGRNQTVVTLRVGQKAWANAYLGVLYVGHYNATSSMYSATTDTCDPTGKQFDDFVGFQLANQTVTGEPCNTYINETYSNGVSKGLTTGIVLAIAHNNNDESLDTGEKGYLIVTLAANDAAAARNPVDIEIRLEKTATLSIEFSIPESMPPNSYVAV
jgi:flagellin FlaB